MPDVLKFRVYDVAAAQMHEVTALVWVNGKPRARIADGRDTTNPETDPIMQFTGFLDSKKQEIYSGDICRYWMDGRWKVGYVTWSRGGAALRVVKYGNERVDWLFEFQRFIPTPKTGNIMGDQFEVIGNIYQNLELLEAAS